MLRTHASIHYPLKPLRRYSGLKIAYFSQDHRQIRMQHKLYENQQKKDQQTGTQRDPDTNLYRPDEAPVPAELPISSSPIADQLYRSTVFAKPMAASSDSSPNDQPGLPASIFPERNPEKSSEMTKSGFFGWYSKMVTAPYDVTKCEQLVDQTLKHPALKLLIRAMKSSGCQFNPKRHISCEPCASQSVAGAYDPKYNQVAVCANNRSPTEMLTVLGYNMLQMFDSCRAHVDFRNIDHMACAEVRANNLFVCGTYTEGRKRGDAPILGYEGKQPECVRTNAIAAVQQMLNVDEPTARAAVDRVFNRCYFDMEPFGQRFENETVAEILYERRRNYGYY